MTVQTGWTPPIKDPKCLRCGKPTGTVLYMLCQECHGNDLKAENRKLLIEEKVKGD